MDRPAPALPRIDHARPWRQTRVKRCANCDIQLGERAFEHDGKIYCCDGCAMGGPCVC